MAAEAAIGAEHEPLRLDVPQGIADERCHFIRLLDLQGAVAHHPDADFLVPADGSGDFGQLGAAVVGGLERDDIDVEAIEVGQHRLIGVARLDALRERVAPAGVAPDLGLVAQAADLAIERLDIGFRRDLPVDIRGVVNAITRQPASASR